MLTGICQNNTPETHSKYFLWTLSETNGNSSTAHHFPVHIAKQNEM